MRVKLLLAVALLCLTLTVGVACRGATQTNGSPPQPTVQPTAPPAPTEPVQASAVSGMVIIPAGAFTMGASVPERLMALQFGWSQDWLLRMAGLIESAGPTHQVVLDAYRIDRHEVTNEQYEAFLDATGYPLPRFWNQPSLNADNQPVTGVSWHDAQTYCSWTGKRLPTEAEWEKAARGTDGLAYPWGEVWDSAMLRSAEGVAGRAMANYHEWTLWRSGSMSDGGPAPVGSYPGGASPYGVLDMAGNVWEWVADWYDPEYYSTALEENPSGPASGVARVLRGGAWDVPSVVAFTWFREIFIPPDYNGSAVVGFRCASNEPPAAPPNERAGLTSGRRSP